MSENIYSPHPLPLSPISRSVYKIRQQSSSAIRKCLRVFEKSSQLTNYYKSPVINHKTPNRGHLHVTHNQFGPPQAVPTSKNLFTSINKRQQRHPATNHDKQKQHVKIPFRMSEESWQCAM